MLILTKAQAEAVYRAMCELNNIGDVHADLIIQRRSKSKNQELIKVFNGQVSSAIYVQLGCRPAIKTEHYDDQAAFAAAYGLGV